MADTSEELDMQKENHFDEPLFPTVVRVSPKLLGDDLCTDMDAINKDIAAMWQRIFDETGQSLTVKMDYSKEAVKLPKIN